MDKHAVSVRMTVEQLQLISGLIRLATTLGWGSLDEIWRYFPTQLRYEFGDPKDVTSKVKQNFARIESLSKEAKKLIDVQSADDPRKQLAVDLKDMQNVISQYVNSLSLDGLNFGHEPPVEPQGRFPYMSIQRALD
jgi:hypothetical protein